MSLTKNSAAFDSAMEQAHEQADERNLDQLYLESIHDQACIQRDAVMLIVKRFVSMTGYIEKNLPEELYSHFYEQVKRKP